MAQATGLTIDPLGQVVHEATEEGYRARQDYLDGRALRLLREALPEDGSLTIRLQGPLFDAIRRGVIYWYVDAVTMTGVGDTEGSGSTIAEAADKCRAALPPDVAKLRNEGTI